MALIPDDIIGEIRSRADIVAVIGQHVKLRKAGQNHKGLCPFHSEKSPSFNVNAGKGFFYCFGCQKKGDVFSFLMEYEGKSFLEAAEVLAQMTGVTIPAPTYDPGAERRRSEKSDMLRINQAATAFFRAELAGPRGAAARAYLVERGTSDETSEAFRLGYAPDDWRALADHLASEHLSLELAEALGLIAKQPRAGGHYDRFRHRLVCPVIQPGGDVVGFSARALPNPTTAGGGEAPAKYINSPESLLYKKSRLLFGLHRAQAGFRRRDRAVLVEGNFDVISLHQAGVDEAVAPLGTALTEDQVEILRRYVPQVVLLYDGDNAGRAATVKSLKMLIAGNLEVRIATVPPGQDPDSLARTGGAEAVAELLTRARPGVEYFIFDVWGRSDGSTDRRAAAMAEAADVLRSVADPTKRDLWIGQLASALEVDGATLRQALRRALTSGRSGGRGGNQAASHRPGPTSRPAVAQVSNNSGDSEDPAPPGARSEGAAEAAPAVRQMGPPPGAELELLKILADHPNLLSLAEKLDLLSVLTDSRLRDMYSAAREGQAMWWSAPSSDREMTEQILSGAFAHVDDPAHSLEDSIANLRKSQAKTALGELQRQIEDAQRQGDVDRLRDLIQMKRETLTNRKQVD